MSARRLQSSILGLLLSGSMLVVPTLIVLPDSAADANSNTDPQCHGWIDCDGKVHDVNTTAGGGKKDDTFRKAHPDWEKLFKQGDEVKKQGNKKPEKCPCKACEK